MVVRGGRRQGKKGDSGCGMEKSILVTRYGCVSVLAMVVSPNISAVTLTRIDKEAGRQAVMTGKESTGDKGIPVCGGTLNLMECLSMFVWTFAHVYVC